MTLETTRSRFRKVLDGQLPTDRLPMMEWAMWWDATLRHWQSQGLSQEADCAVVKRHFGLDIDRQYWSPITTESSNSDSPTTVVTDQDYAEIQRHLRLDINESAVESWRQAAQDQAAGECVVWLTLNGFFWWPRTLLGIERHLMAFYDQPALMHRMNEDLLALNLQYIDEMAKFVVPDFMTFAEDMSYNHGAMLSKPLFDAFIAPYYRRIVPELKARGIRVLVDTDGNVERLIPWLESVGVEGCLPVEVRAGNDIAGLRARHPEFILIGGFDKTAMHHGEHAMRAEFERLLPVMRTGRFIPSVDHQTPPDVSIHLYQTYVALLEEYCRRAVA